MDTYNGRVYLWATNAEEALRKVEAATGMQGLAVRGGDLTRPGGYDYTGTIEEDNIKEVIGVSQRRYSVGPARGVSTFNIDVALAARKARR